MKATGIVRRIDDLGRVVIPKEIRRSLRIREGDPLEIFVDRDGEIIFKKYSPFVGLENFAKEYTDSLFKATGHIACIADRDMFIAVSGAPKKEFLHQSFGDAVEQAMQERRTIKLDRPGKEMECRSCEESSDCKATAKVIAPIIADGDPIGAVILCAVEPNIKMGEIEIKLAETAAEFLGKQVSQ
jgi:AbrB family transcriptional regulator (stage V sporulation protein T)